MAGSGVEGKTLEFTPSWVVASVCFGIVLISLAVEKILLCVGQLLQKSRWKMLVGAFRKIKEELMLLGFISLLLAVFQTRIEKICIPERLANVWLPCKKPGPSSTTGRTRGRSLLNEASASTDFCSEKGKVPLLTAEALHDLDIFIFVLATSHVILCVVKILLGYIKIHQWNKSAESAKSAKSAKSAAHDVGSNPSLCELQHELRNTQKDGGCLANLENKPSNLYHDLQIELREMQKDGGCLANLENKPKELGWMCSFFKQFYPSVTKFEYLALHLNFMREDSQSYPQARDVDKPGEDSQPSPQAHDLPQQWEDFSNYIIDVVRNDFEKIVGIRWYLWILAVIFLLVNVAGWHAYFWISFIPLTLLLIAGTILEHTITRLAEKVAQNSEKELVLEEKVAENSEKELVLEEKVAEKSEKELVSNPSDYFWFRWYHFVLLLIHIVLFQNSLELISFFFVLFQYDFHSCIMGKAGFAISRIVIGAFVQFMCIYRTLPLYAIMKSQCRDEMSLVTLIWKWYERMRLATNKFAENCSRHRSAGTTEQMKGGEVELETRADIEAPEIRECTSDTKNN